MKDRSKIFRMLLNRFAVFVGSLDEREVAALADGSAKLTLVVEKRAAGQARGDKSQELFADDQPEKTAKSEGLVENVVRSLTEASDRTRALEILSAEAPTRKTLEAIARYLQLPILRADNSDRVRERIIAHVVGSRLNSRAIRGE